MMDDCQDEAIWSSQGEKDQHKRQRPLLVGSFLLGLGLCCLFFVYPAMMIADMEAEEKAADRMSETKANHLLALICIMAAFASPLLALRLKNISATDISTNYIY
jgi:nitrate reductase gamma subunit